MRKIYVKVVTHLIIRADDGVDVDDILSDMDYDFVSNSDGADIEDTEIKDWEIIDSK